jgi:hypothetical protein
MREKRIEEEKFKLGFRARIKLVFGILPNTIGELRHLFSRPVQISGYSLSLLDEIDIRLGGQIQICTPLWIEAFKKWVLLCGDDMQELKEALNEARFNFPPRDGSPLLDFIVPIILNQITDERMRTIHASEPDLYFLASGANLYEQPDTAWRQAAVLKWCKLTTDKRSIPQRSYFFVRGSKAYAYATETLGLTLDETQVRAPWKESVPQVA